MTHENSLFEIGGYKFGPLGKDAYCPVPPTAFLFVNVGEDESSWEIRGESHYEEGISRVFNKFLAEGAERNSLLALLVHEPKNPHDPNAIRVDLALTGQSNQADVAVAGYLGREMAEQFFEMVIAAMDKGYLPVMSVQVIGGTPAKPSLGVWLGAGDAGAHSESQKLGVADLFPG